MSATRILDVKTTTRTEMIDITSLVRGAIRQSGVEEGLACVFCPHTTAAVTMQENRNPAVKRDVIAHLARLIPRQGTVDRPEDNSDAHIKSSVIGGSLTLLVEGGRPVLGTWQGLYLCEFDGPRSRRILVRVVPG